MHRFHLLMFYFVEIMRLTITHCRTFVICGIDFSSVTPRCRWGAPTDAYMVMVARRFISSAVNSSVHND